MWLIEKWYLFAAADADVVNGYCWYWAVVIDVVVFATTADVRYGQQNALTRVAF